MDPKEFCGDLTFCKSARAAMFAEETSPAAAHCKPCLNMVDDIISIAQNDVNHWNQMWTALSKQMCSEGIGKAEQKFCFKVRKDICNSKTNKPFRNLVMHKREPVSTWPNKTQRNHARLSSTAKLFHHFLYTFPIN